MIEFTILGIPMSKQSARFRATKFGDKTFVKSYQPKDIVDKERSIAMDVRDQLPEGFQPYTEGLRAQVSFVFPFKKTMTKKEKEYIANGGVIYKTTKPDLTDNLMKGLFDAMAGIVYINDSQICATTTEKVYGPIPMTCIRITPAYGYVRPSNL